MASFTAVDLSKLQAPDLIETLDFKKIFAEALSQFRRLLPEFSALTEANPVYKILQLFAARELLIRQLANDKAQQTMLAFAIGNNLNHLGALLGVARLVLNPGQPENGPAATYESDMDFRRRIQLAPEGFSVAGSEGAYIYHALSAAADVTDASATSPAPGQVLVTVQPRTGDGNAPQALLDQVASILTNDDVRPLTDSVTVQSAQIVPYAIRGRVYTYVGPDSAVVMREALRSLRAYLDEAHRIGRDVLESAIKAKLFADGVQRIELTRLQPTSGSAAPRPPTAPRSTSCMPASMSNSPLPPNATPMERALAAVTERREAVPLPYPDLWNPDTCPAGHLPWLAGTLSVDDWKADWSDAVKRSRLRSAMAIQRREGAANSVRMVVESFGGAVAIREWWQTEPPGAPHTFELTLTLTGTDGQTATSRFVNEVIAEVERTKPVRSHFAFIQGFQAEARIGVLAVARPAVYRRLLMDAQ